MVLIAVFNNLDKHKVFIYLSIALPILMLIINGCSEKITEEMNSDENSAITGRATTEILRACKYPSEKFCEEKCCQVEEKCKNGDFAYMECDLKTGQWVNETYSDSKCASKCGAFAENIEKNNDLVREKNPVCDEGWKCISKFERSYRLSNCSFTLAERCDRGCMNDSCISLCNPGDFSCRNGILMACNEDGNLWLYHNICEYGCENGQCLDSTNLNETNLTQPQQNNDYITDKCINVANFNYDAAGSDSSSNLNDEYFTLENTCSYSIDMTNWIAKDAANHKFTFPSFSLGSNAEVTIRTGSGADDSTNLYQGRGSHVWNNNGGDTLYLNNTDGTSVLVYSYP